MANEMSPEPGASLVMNREEINIKLGELRNNIATLEDELADIKTFCDDMEDFNCFGSFNNLAKSIAENVIKYNDFALFIIINISKLLKIYQQNLMM